MPDANDPKRIYQENGLKHFLSKGRFIYKNLRGLGDSAS